MPGAAIKSCVLNETTCNAGTKEGCVAGRGIGEDVVMRISGGSTGRTVRRGHDSVDRKSSGLDCDFSGRLHSMADVSFGD
jgi:hypothetical protein